MPQPGAGLFLRRIGAILDIARADPVQKFDLPATVSACCRSSVRKLQDLQGYASTVGHQILQRMPFRQEIRPQRCLHRQQRAPCLWPSLGPVRCDHRQKMTPPPPPGQELFPPRYIFLNCIAQTGKGGLNRHRLGFLQGYPTQTDHAECLGFFRYSLACVVAPLQSAGSNFKHLSPIV